MSGPGELEITTSPVEYYGGERRLALRNLGERPRAASPVRLRRRKLDTSGRPRIAGKRHGQASQPGISVARLDDDGVVARAPTPHSAQRHKQVPRSQGEIAHKGGAQMDDAIFAIGEDFPGIAQQLPEIILLCGRDEIDQSG